MTDLLPPNAISQERDLSNAVAYALDPSIIRGFKFNPPDAFLPALIWEYGLGEVLRWLPDPRRAIREGILWQRLRGTPESLKIALSWADIGAVILEEEGPGQHFAEFQVGVTQVPNQLFVESVIELARLSAPIRARLTRMYNPDYDVRRFRLDHSRWGDLLSDYSGVRLQEDLPVLSFGRKNNYDVVQLTGGLHNADQRNHTLQAVTLDIYRLDHALLDISDPHVLNHRGAYGRIYSTGNDTGIFALGADVKVAQRFAKAQIVLSDSWVLGDINACLPVSTLTEYDAVFVLDDACLSESIWRLAQTPIYERFVAYHAATTQNIWDNRLSNNQQNRHYTSQSAIDVWPVLSNDTMLESALSVTRRRNRYVDGKYGGMDGWHSHHHQQKPWKDTQNAVDRITERAHLGGTIFADVYELYHANDRNYRVIFENTVNSLSHTQQRECSYQAACDTIGPWHGFAHQHQPWSQTPSIIESTHLH